MKPKLIPKKAKFNFPRRFKKSEDEKHMTLTRAMDDSARYIKSILDKIESANFLLSKTAINIGSHDGITLDVLKYLYLENNYGGLCIEDDPKVLEQAVRNIPNKVNKLCKKVTPDNILTILKDYENIDIIDIDIDSYDYCILEKVITLDPKVIVVELNENVPPGITYYAGYDSDCYYSSQGSYQVFGCSIDAVTTLCEKYNYSLLKMEWNNAVLIKNTYSGLFDLPTSNLEAYDLGYFFRENRENVFFWKEDESNGSESNCRNMNTDEAFEYFRNYFQKDLDKITLFKTIK